MGFGGTAILIVLVSLASACCALVLIRAFGQTSDRESALPEQTLDEIVFLFENRSLADASKQARALLPSGEQFADDWSKFLSVFASRFEQLEAKLLDLGDRGHLHLVGGPSGGAAMSLLAEKMEGVTRIAITGSDPHGLPAQNADYSIQAIDLELQTLRTIAETAPLLTWKEQADGTITWANGAYMSHVQAEMGSELSGRWPPRPLFTREATQLIDEADHQRRRVQRDGSDSANPKWYDLELFREDNGTLCYAKSIDDLVRAEASLRDFIATLGKTFAHLTIGLAIFDAKRRLVLFNPALVELTALGAEVLTQRPSLHMFLDALRENQRIPEPRDYKSWRLRIAQLEAAATDGRYQETWTLPTGQTYRVTGQPHPDGAIAFLFEDISAEISLKRRFRSEIDLGQSILDAIDHGVAVFSREGDLVFSNDAYAKLFNVNVSERLSRYGLDAAMSDWGLSESADNIRARLISFVFHSEDRERFSIPVFDIAGQPLDLRVTALPQRSTLVEFFPLDAPLETSEQELLRLAQ